MTLSPRQFAFFSQTNFPPPKNGSVCKASIARPDSRNRLIDVVRAGIDNFDAEFAGIGRRQFRRQLRRDALHLALIRSDDRVDVRFGFGCFRFGLRHAWPQF